MRAGLPLTYMVGAESRCSENAGTGVGSLVLRLRLTSPIWFAGQAGDVVHEQFVCDQARGPSARGVPSPPAERSPSSPVKVNSVFDLSIPSAASRAKKMPK